MNPLAGEKLSQVWVTSMWLVIVLGVASAAGNENSKSEKVRTPVEQPPAPAAGVVAQAAYPIVAEPPQTATRLREGVKLTEELGEFQKSGERYTFSFKTGKLAVRVLENQSLERVARTLDEDPTPRMWCVSGQISEFRGENYLMITKAQFKPRPAGTLRPADATDPPVPTTQINRTTVDDSVKAKK